MRPLIRISLPPVPASIGTWLRLDRVARHKERVTFRVTFETGYGGTVAHWFATKRLAHDYAEALLKVNPWAAVMPGSTVTH